jgi:hypothetical protein
MCGFCFLLSQRLRTYTVGAAILPLANFYNMRRPKRPQTVVCDLVRPDFLDLDKKPMYGLSLPSLRENVDQRPSSLTPLSSLHNR